MATVPTDPETIARHRSECPRLKGRECPCQCRGCSQAWRDHENEELERKAAREAARAAGTKVTVNG